LRGDGIQEMKVRFVLILLIDAILAVTAHCSALGLRFGSVTLREEWLSRQSLQTAVIFVIAVLFSSYLMEVYTLDRRCSRWETFVNCLQASGTAFFFLFVVYYLAPSMMMGRGVLLLSITFFFVYQVLWHAFSAYAVKAPQFCQRVLILGSGRLAVQLGELIRTGHTPFTLAGYLKCRDECENEEQPLASELLVSREVDLLTTVRKVGAGVMVVALSERRGVLPLQEMMQCKLEGIKVIDAPTFYELVQEKLMLEEITPGWIIFSAGFHRTALSKVYKRCIDMILSLLGILLTAPLFPLIALAIKVDSPGPLFFTQVRVGSGEVPFVLYKFRSMSQDAERDGAVWALKDDARVTRVGRILRDYRIDELPQLFNVLKGDMSFIGPRPERPEFVESLKKEILYYSKRHTIKPGLTGWAQVRYPYGATVEDALEKLRFDLYYIKNVSFLLDSQIIFETMKVVLFGRGGR
jgi:sugar transferase (PEP-CTERM system associated)